MIPPGDYLRGFYVRSESRSQMPFGKSFAICRLTELPSLENILNHLKLYQPDSLCPVEVIRLLERDFKVPISKLIVCEYSPPVRSLHEPNRDN